MSRFVCVLLRAGKGGNGGNGGYVYQKSKTNQAGINNAGRLVHLLPTLLSCVLEMLRGISDA